MNNQNMRKQKQTWVSVVAVCMLVLFSLVSAAQRPQDVSSFKVTPIEGSSDEVSPLIDQTILGDQKQPQQPILLDYDEELLKIWTGEAVRKQQEKIKRQRGRSLSDEFADRQHLSEQQARSIFDLLRQPLPQPETQVNDSKPSSQTDELAGSMPNVSLSSPESGKNVNLDDLCAALESERDPILRHDFSIQNLQNQSPQRSAEPFADGSPQQGRSADVADECCRCRIL